MALFFSSFLFLGELAGWLAVPYRTADVFPTLHEIPQYSSSSLPSNVLGMWEIKNMFGFMLYFCFHHDDDDHHHHQQHSKVLLISHGTQTKPNQTIMILCLFLVSGKQRNEHSFFFISKFFVLFIWRKFIEENVSVKVQKRREHFHVVVVVVVVAFENFYFALGFLLRTFYFYSRGGKREKVNSEISKWGYPRLLFN